MSLPPQATDLTSKRAFQRTLVISDLHLGGSLGVDILRRPENRAALKAELAGCDRLVLLGDTLELRHGPVRDVLGPALDALSDIASALDPGCEVVVLAGNHDHALIAPWLDQRARSAKPSALTAEQIVAADSGWLPTLIAEAFTPANVVLAYPGIWLRDDVYAFHGHYLDRHIEIPTFERLAAGVMARITGRSPVDSVGPDDYEAVLGPMYAWAYALAQQAEGRGAQGAHGASKRVWDVLSGASGHRPIRRRLASFGFAGAVGVLNLLKLGPLHREISPARLRSAGIESAAAAAKGIRVSPDHLIYGHTHRPGPLSGDQAAEWLGSDGTQLWNSGSWVFEEHFLKGAKPGSPYWPGRVVEVLESGPPRIISTLNDLSAAEIVGNMQPLDDLN